MVLAYNSYIVPRRYCRFMLHTIFIFKHLYPAFSKAQSGNYNCFKAMDFLGFEKLNVNYSLRNAHNCGIYRSKKGIHRKLTVALVSTFTCIYSMGHSFCTTHYINYKLCLVAFFSPPHPPKTTTTTSSFVKLRVYYWKVFRIF